MQLTGCELVGVDAGGGVSKASCMLEGGSDVSCVHRQACHWVCAV